MAAALLMAIALTGQARTGAAEEAAPASTAAAAEAPPTAAVAPPLEATAALAVAAPEPAAPPPAATAALPPTDEVAPEASAAAPATGPSDDGDEAPAPEAAAGVALPDLSVLTAEPVRGVANSGFGWRDDPIRHHRRFHRGTDFRAPRGTPVYAAAAGTVVFAGRRHGYGKVIDVRHADGLLTRYAHLDSMGVSLQQEVACDETIARVGSTGRATGPHLHFEVRIAGRAVDPNVAVRVGELQQAAPAFLVRLAAMALRPEVQEATVSTLDPPRAPRSPRPTAPARPKRRPAS